MPVGALLRASMEATADRGRLHFGGLFRGRNFFDRCSFDVSLFALFSGVAQELVDNARALLLLNPSLLHFLLFSEELVVYFPAH